MTEHCNIKQEDQEEQRQSEVNASELLWKVIGRFDYYIGTTNTKAAGLITFNTFVFSSVVLKFEELLPTGQPKWQIILSAASLAIAALSALISLLTIFRSLHPFTSSSENDTDYRSSIFFAHIANLKTPAKYFAFIKKLTTNEFDKDLAVQAYSLSTALVSKFSSIQVATKAVGFELIAVGLAISLKFYSIILRSI
jgi:Family of unknown function (DUF5706)